MNPSPHLRHQSSLETILDLSSSRPVLLEASLHARAQDKFNLIVSHFETVAAAVPTAHYNRPALVRLTYEYSRSDLSKDMFLRAFFDYMKLSMDGQDVDLTDFMIEADVRFHLLEFANYLFSNFFLPSRALTPSR